MKVKLPANFLTREDGTEMRLLSGPWTTEENQTMGTAIGDLERSYIQWKLIRHAGAYWLYRQTQGYRQSSRSSPEDFKRILAEDQSYRYKPSKFQRILRDLERRPIDLKPYLVR